MHVEWWKLEKMSLVLHLLSYLRKYILQGPETYKKWTEHSKIAFFEIRIRGLLLHPKYPPNLYINIFLLRVKQFLRTEISHFSSFSSFFPNNGSHWQKLFYRCFLELPAMNCLTNCLTNILTKFLTNLFDKFLTYNLLTIASFRIGVPSIFFEFVFKLPKHGHFLIIYSYFK